MDYTPGTLESAKFLDRKGPYYEGLEKTLSLGFSQEDLIHYFPSFTGHMTLSRYLVLYEAYKMTLGVAGHIAELGVYKGAGSLLFGKLCQIFEPGSLTQVHGFDWFEGTNPTEEEPNVNPGSYKEDYQRIVDLVEAQQMNNIVHIHKLDLTADLPAFFKKFPHLQFKLLFFDAGQYDIVSHALENLWDRLTPGGILLLDQFNHDLSPGETRAVKEFLPDAEIKTFPFGWLPSAYIKK